MTSIWFTSHLFCPLNMLTYSDYDYPNINHHSSPLVYNGVIYVLSFHLLFLQKTWVVDVFLHLPIFPTGPHSPNLGAIPLAHGQARHCRHRHRCHGLALQRAAGGGGAMRHWRGNHRGGGRQAAWENEVEGHGDFELWEWRCVELKKTKLRNENQDETGTD